MNRDVGQRLILFSEIEKIRIRERTERGGRRLLRIGDADRNQFVWCRKGQRLQEHGINYTEDGGGGADAERECDYGNKGEGRMLYQLAQSVLNVVHHTILDFRFWIE